MPILKQIKANSLDAPAERAPVDDPPQLRLAAAAAAPGGVSGPGAAPTPGPAHLDHAPPPEGGQLSPESTENKYGY